MQFYCSEQMQNRELNTCKQDIYSFLHFLLPTNTEPCKVPVFVFRPVAGSLLFIGRAENGDVRTDIPVACVVSLHSSVFRQ